MRDWLMQAAERGDVVRQERPVRYTLPEEKTLRKKPTVQRISVRKRLQAKTMKRRSFSTESKVVLAGLDRLAT
jgi:predicted exporter